MVNGPQLATRWESQRELGGSAAVRLRFSALLVVTLFVMSCGPAGAADSRGGQTSGGPAAAQKKTLTVAYGRAITHIGPMEGGVAEFREIAQAGLLVLDPVTNRVLPRLAEEVPS